MTLPPASANGPYALADPLHSAAELYSGHVNSIDYDASRLVRPVVCAGAAFTDADRSILLVKPTYKNHWDIPGGYVELGETPRAACVREVYEEMGIRPAIGRLLSVDWAPHPDVGEKVLFVFDGGLLDDETLGAIEFADGEISEYKFVPAEHLDRFTIPRLVNRLRSSLDAKFGGQPTYLEDGLRP